MFCRRDYLLLPPPQWKGVAASSACPGDGREGCAPVLGPKMQGGDLVSTAPSPLGPAAPRDPHTIR